MSRINVLVLFCLSGCAVYRIDNSRSDVDFSQDAARQNEKLSCRIVHRLEVQKVPIPFQGDVPIKFGLMEEEVLLPLQKDSFMENLQGRDVFSCCIEGLGVSKTDFDIDIQSECRFSWSENVGQALLTVFTVTLFPGCFHNYYFNYSFTVTRKDGLVRQYRFKKEVVDRFGVLMLFAMPFMDSPSHEGTFNLMNKSVILELLDRMNKDGFFTKAKDSLEDRGGVSFPSQSESATGSMEKMKELESLKAAGVISEEDFRSEVERMRRSKGK